MSTYTQRNSSMVPLQWSFGLVTTRSMEKDRAECVLRPPVVNLPKELRVAFTEQPLYPSALQCRNIVPGHTLFVYHKTESINTLFG